MSVAPSRSAKESASFDNPCAPASGLFAITPNDTDELAHYTMSFYVGTGGDVAVVDLYGNETVIPDIPDGYIYPARVKKVLATGTTASGIVGLY